MINWNNNMEIKKISIQVINRSVGFCSVNRWRIDMSIFTSCSMQSSDKYSDYKSMKIFIELMKTKNEQVLQQYREYLQ